MELTLANLRAKFGWDRSCRSLLTQDRLERAGLPKEVIDRIQEFIQFGWAVGCWQRGTSDWGSIVPVSTPPSLGAWVIVDEASVPPESPEEP